MTTPDPVAFYQAKIKGCRKGGQRSGQARRAAGLRKAVEAAIADQRRKGQYGRDSAARIARYVGVSARYVRKVARETGGEIKRN